MGQTQSKELVGRSKVLVGINGNRTNTEKLKVNVGGMEEVVKSKE